MIWFPLSIGAALFWAIGQILLKKGFENIPPLWNNIISNLLMIIILLLPAFILSRFSLTIPSLQLWFIMLVAASFYMLFYYALSKGKVALVGTIIATYPLWTILLSFTFLGERIIVLQYAGIVFILIGSITIALPERKDSRVHRDLSWIIWGFSTAFFMGTGDFLTKLSINAIGSHSYIFFISIISNILSFPNYLIDKKARKFPHLTKEKFYPTIAGISVSLIGTFLFLLSFDFGKASLVTPVSSIYPAFTAVLAYRFLKEKIMKRHVCGIGLTVAGLVLVGFGFLYE